MKLRIVLSVIVAILGWLTESTYKMFYSPITGVATAQSLNEDSGTGYAFAKFVREGGFENLIIGSTLVVLALIWLIPSRKTKANQN